jgi:glycosyltransferase involved in cell wall biosynthesis
LKYNTSLYYSFKPLIPRKVQILLRRVIIRRNLSKYRDVWPVNPKAGTAPAGWKGWPEKKAFAFVLIHDVDTAKGQQKSRQLADLERGLGFRSSFNFVPRRYDVQPDLRRYLNNNGFEVGVHGLYHDGKYYASKEIFRNRALQINKYLREWNAVGFRSPSMLHNLAWIHDLDVEYDASTFDTDPFEPQPDGAGTIFPFWVSGNSEKKGYVELPYTLPQDFTLFVLMKEKTIDIWKKKMDWIVENGGMALVSTHPDYMNFSGKGTAFEEYPVEYYEELLKYVSQRYKGKYWHVLPRGIAEFWKNNFGAKKT